MLQLTDKILKVGVENARFRIPCLPLRDAGFIAYTSSNDKPVVQECTIDEERYKVKDNYKIALKPVDSAYAGDTFYIMDLTSLMRQSPDLYIFVNDAAEEN